MTDILIQEMGERDTAFGLCLYLRIQSITERQLSWDEVWEAFSQSYPGLWAVQMFPPAHRLINEANLYHLYVLPTYFRPVGLDINRRPDSYGIPTR